MTPSSRAIAAIAVAALAAGGCREAPKPAPSPPPPAAPTAAPEAREVAPPAPAAAPALLDPGQAAERAPETFKVRFATTKGSFVVQAHRSWAPHGADRFYNLVKIGYLDDVAFFRVIEGFMVQFGIHGDPAVNENWREARIPDDEVKQSNRRGRITFATAGPDTRTTQLFINFKDNTGLDRQGFAPFGEVIEGMAVVDSLYSGYGEGAPSGKGPRQDRAQFEGNAYLKREFPKLDYVKKANLTE
jgi:cyclophilin family peptidyl-prolyl cis-trans isomerase